MDHAEPQHLLPSGSLLFLTIRMWCLETPESALPLCLELCQNTFPACCTGRTGHCTAFMLLTRPRPLLRSSVYLKMAGLADTVPSTDAGHHLIHAMAALQKTCFAACGQPGMFRILISLCPWLLEVCCASAQCATANGILSTK